MKKIYVHALCALSLLFTVSLLSLHAQGPQVLIPVPSSYELKEGTYAFDSEPAVRVNFVSKGLPGKEAYVMDITSKGVKVKAMDEAGVFYAKQTLF